MSSILPIVQRFHSLQGEGAHYGKSAFFIRLGGCNVGCSWCDTKESWSHTSHEKINVSDLAEEVKIAQSQGAGILIITGGEPLHHNLNPLCKAIREKTSNNHNWIMPIHLETSGINEMSGSIDWITLSPKRHLEPTKNLLRACDEIKVVIHKQEDIFFAEKMAKESHHQKQVFYTNKSNEHNKPLKPHLFLQPGWESEEGKQLAIQYIKTHPEWRLSLQAHKWLGVL